jgi:hypothetical protein
VGETLKERESKKTLEVIFRQLAALKTEIDDREHSSWGTRPTHTQLARLLLLKPTHVCCRGVG